MVEYVAKEECEKYNREMGIQFPMKAVDGHVSVVETLLFWRDLHIYILGMIKIWH